MINETIAPVFTKDELRRKETFSLAVFPLSLFPVHKQNKTSNLLFGSSKIQTLWATWIQFPSTYFSSWFFVFFLQLNPPHLMVNRVGKKSRIFKPSFSVQSPTTRIWKIIYSSSASSLALFSGLGQHPSNGNEWTPSFLFLKKNTKQKQWRRTKQKVNKQSAQSQLKSHVVCLMFVCSSSAWGFA